MVDAVVWRLKLENGGTDDNKGSGGDTRNDAAAFWGFMRGIAAKSETLKPKR